MSRPKEFLYRPVSSLKVPGFVIDKIGEDLVQPAQTPFKEGFLSDFSRVVVNHRKSRSIPELIQVSPTHNRVFEMRYNSEGFIFWADEYGNIYGTLQSKGGNVAKPDVRVEQRAPSGFRIWGIQESDSILRAVRASNLMRSHNVATEAFVRLIEPTELQFKGERVSQDEFKKRLIEKIWHDNHRKLLNDKSGNPPVTRQDIPRLASELQKMAFYISTLGRQVSERFLDLKFVSSKEDLQKVMKRVFTFWNAKNKHTHDFDSNNLDDIYRFFTTDLPAEVARNYAILHGELDLLHIYPHLGNVSLVGSIYDDDSVYGESLGIGDEKVTEEQKIEDIELLLAGKKNFQHADGIINLLNNLEQRGIFPEKAKISKGFAKTFVVEYIKNRGWADSFIPNLRHIENLVYLSGINLFLKENEDIRSTLVEIAGQENLDLLVERHLIRYYHYPLVVDMENIVPSQDNAKETPVVVKMTEERKKEVLGLARQLLTLHQEHLSKYPDTGKNYFSFPKVDQEILVAHKTLKKDQIIDIVRLWTSGDIAVLGQDFYSKTFGSFLLTLAQVNSEAAFIGLKTAIPAKDNPQFIEKMSRIHELFEVLPTFERYRSYLHELLDNNREEFHLEKETGYRSGIALFGKGIVTRSFHEIFNHRLMDIILNEFTNEQEAALKEAFECPELVDRLGYKETVIYFLKTALTGIQVRNGQIKDLALASEITEEEKTATSGYLQYLLASEDKDKITDEKLIEAMESEISSGWMSSMARHLIIAKKALHPNSFYAQTFKETGLGANDMADILKVALDITKGNLEKLDPTLKEMLKTKEYKGIISTKKAAELVWSCMGFGVDLPEILEPALTQNENRLALMSFLSENTVFREEGIYGKHTHYPLNPIYSLMSKGVESLPGKVRDLFANYDGNQTVINALAEGIMDHLFTNEYLRFYFGGLINLEDYPEAPIDMKDLLVRYESGKNGYQMWRTVHPDIWNILRLADTEVIKKFFKTDPDDAKALIEFRTIDKQGKLWYGQRETPISECLPPDLYEKLKAVEV